MSQTKQPSVGEVRGSDIVRDGDRGGDYIQGNETERIIGKESTHTLT